MASYGIFLPELVFGRGFLTSNIQRKFINIKGCCLIVSLNFKFPEIKNQLLSYSPTATEEGKEKVFPTYVFYKEILYCQQQLYRYSFGPIFYSQTLKKENNNSMFQACLLLHECDR
jgi:hypothetical protein